MRPNRCSYLRIHVKAKIVALPKASRDPSSVRGYYRDSIYNPHGLCQLNLAHTNECYELSLFKGVLLKVGGGMQRYLSITQVDIWRETSCVPIKIYEWIII